MDDVPEGVEQVDGQVLSAASAESNDSTNFERQKKECKEKLQLVHKQRIPANSKDIILADIDGDGSVEMVLGLTDRVVRSYRWYSAAFTQKSAVHMPEPSDPDKVSGILHFLKYLLLTETLQGDSSDSTNGNVPIRSVL